MWVNYQQFTGVASRNFTLNGNGWGYGFTAGATFTPTASTTIGVGYRSALNQKINGGISNGVGATTNVPVTATLNLPDMLTVGLRQGLNDRWTLLAGFEWTNWSRIGTAGVFQQATGAPALGTTGTAITLPFQYSDGFFYSLGAEYKYNPSWTLRTGIAFEKSPITDGVRTPRLPDNDRMWYSGGFTYKPVEIKGLAFDFGYSYVKVKSTPIDISAASGNPWFVAGFGTYQGSVDTSIHIISVAARYQWDADPAPVTKQRYAK